MVERCGYQAEAALFESAPVDLRADVHLTIQYAGDVRHSHPLVSLQGRANTGGRAARDRDLPRSRPSRRSWAWISGQTTFDVQVSMHDRVTDVAVRARSA
jgi:hypothetical protein